MLSVVRLDVVRLNVVAPRDVPSNADEADIYNKKNHYKFDYIDRIREGSML
jgi:hypothetical protein